MTRDKALDLIADFLIAYNDYEHIWATHKDEKCKKVKDAGKQYDSVRLKLLRALCKN